MRRSSALCGRWRAALMVVALLTAGTGCTMCPDPYDYTGPVPNGSSPQNDFRARSNGVLPIGGTARPWPAIVSHEAPRPGPGGVPTLAAAPPEADLLGGPSPLASVLLQEQEEASEPPAAVLADADGGPDEPQAGITRAADADDDVVAMLLPAREPPPQATVPARETPGWKPRR